MLSDFSPRTGIVHADESAESADEQALAVRREGDCVGVTLEGVQFCYESVRHLSVSCVDKGWVGRW